MVGRGALGQPWIFAELRGDKAPSTGDKLALILEHARLARAWYGSEHAIVRLRGQLLRYADGLVNSSADGADINTDTDADFYPDLRTAFRSVTTLLELAHLLRPHLSGATRHPAAALAHGGAPVAL